MKVTKQETFYHEDHGATLKHKCGRRIVALSLLTFSLIFWAFSFLWPFSFFIPHLGQCSRKWWSSHFYLFTTQWLQLDTRTKYDSIWMPPAVYRDNNELRVTCMKNYERWLCHKYDVNYMIMQGNMTMMKRAIKKERWKVAWQYISEWLWKCHNR